MAEAQRGGLLDAYLIVGADELKRKTAVARLKRRVPDDLVDFNLDELEAKSIESPDALVSSLNTMPFGAKFRLVLVHGADTLPKPVSEAIVSYLANPNPSCVLCLVAEKLAKNTRLYKAVAKRGKTAVVDCASAKRWELPPLVCKMAAAHGKTMAPAAAEELIARVGESTTMLDNQVATLASLVAERPEISRDDVVAHVAQIAEVKPWTLLDAACERNAARTMELYRLMGDASDVFLHTQVVNRLRELVCAKSLEARGQSGALATELGRAPWQVKNHMRWARNFTSAELVRLIRQAARCERVLKGTGDSETAMVQLLLAMASRNASRA